MTTSTPLTKKQSRASLIVWLAYTGFLFIEPAFNPHAHLWPRTLAVFFVFLTLYGVYVSTCRPAVRLSMIALCLLLGIITIPWNTGGSTFFIYAAAFLPFAIESIPWILAGFAVELLALAGEVYFTGARTYHLSWPTAFIDGALLLIVGCGNIFWAQQRRADAKLRLAHEEVEAIAAVAERERIARDLHDVLGHTLSLIVLKAELAGRLLERDPARAAAEIADVERTARTTLADVREAIGGYRTRGLAAEIESARRTLAAAGVDLAAEATDVAGVKLSAAEETVFALALREGVTNIVRHAHATSCRLHFENDNGFRRLVLEDNGTHESTREGNGLRGMRERVEALGGRFLLAREKGTRLEIDLPA